MHNFISPDGSQFFEKPDFNGYFHTCLFESVFDNIDNIVKEV